MNKIRKKIVVQCSLSFPLSKTNIKFTPILVITKTISGKELDFLCKSESVFINIGLKNKEAVINVIII